VDVATRFVEWGESASVEDLDASAHALEGCATAGIRLQI
jgi:hypothetical protein